MTYKMKRDPHIYDQQLSRQTDPRIVWAHAGYGQEYTRARKGAARPISILVDHESGEYCISAQSWIKLTDDPPSTGSESADETIRLVIEDARVRHAAVNHANTLIDLL